MTTIATDGVTMAADSRGTINDIIATDSVNKIVELNDGSLVGVSGRSTAIRKIAVAIEYGTRFPEGDWTALHLTKDGVFLYSAGADGQAHKVDTPTATGSGRLLAVGAMLHGASPRRAVEIAAMRDPFTGGPVSVKKLTCSSSQSDD